MKNTLNIFSQNNTRGYSNTEIAIFNCRWSDAVIKRRLLMGTDEYLKEAIDFHSMAAVK